VSQVRTIGQAAAVAGVTPRTLRYYEELGLLTPSGRSTGGARRYDDADIERLGRIRQLQDLLGHDLEQIRRVMAAEDRLAELRVEWQGGALDRRRQQEILAEAMEINATMRAQVRRRIDALQAFADELEEKARRYREFSRELQAGAPS
jgi:DNA-binding transcriptional MerR regulator